MLLWKQKRDFPLILLDNNEIIAPLFLLNKTGCYTYIANVISNLLSEFNIIHPG